MTSTNRIYKLSAVGGAMPEHNERIAAVLTKLRSTCCDLEELLRSAAEGVRTPELKGLLVGQIGSVEAIASELREEVRQLGGEATAPAEDTIVGVLRRTWLHIKASVNDVPAVLSVCQRQAETLCDELTTAAECQPPLQVQTLIGRQIHRVAHLADRLRAYAADAGAKPVNRSRGGPANSRF